MIKVVLIVLLLLVSFSAKSQNASTYFPDQLGFTWYYETVLLDTNQMPIPNSGTSRLDSLTGVALYQGRNANIIVSSRLGDSSFVSFDGTNAVEYIGPSVDLKELPPALSDSLRSFFGWYSTYRFAQTINQNYTLFSRSFNVALDSTTTLPIVISVTGRRLSDQTVTVPKGTFINSKRFLLTTSVGTQLLPPPFPTIPLFTVTDTSWLAQQTWIVKRVTPSVSVNLSAFGVPVFTIPGQITVLSTPPPKSSSPISLKQESFQLLQNYPNPFNPTTVIPYRLSQPSNIQLDLYDLLGRKLATLVKAKQPAGDYVYSLNAGSLNLSSGVYFYKLNVGALTQTRKMILAR